MSGAVAPFDERGLPTGYSYHPEWEWTPREVAARLRSPQATDRPMVLDCRTEKERAIVAIVGSRFVPLHELEARIDEIREWIEESGQPTVIVHCHHGVRSLRATAVLRAAGVDAHSLAGGIDLWARDVDPTLPRY